MNKNTEKYLEDLYTFIRKKEEENAVTYCRIPEHKSMNAYIGIYEDVDNKIVYLVSWNTIVCGYKFFGNYVRSFCTWIYSRSTIRHISLFAKYACLSYEDYFLMKDIAKTDGIRKLSLDYGTYDDNKYRYNKTVSMLKESTFRKKPIFKTDNYINWINC